VPEIRDQCLDHDVAFFFCKQWGGLSPKSGSRELDGKEWSQFPKVKHAVGTPAFSYLKN
jgi:protein gp37